MKNKVSGFILANKAAIILLVLAVGMSFATPVFFTSVNLVNVIRQTSTSAILACGYCMILGAGYIDLSVGSQIGMMGALMAILMRGGAPTIVAILGAMVFGVLLGCVNAFIITTFDLPAFIVTLASQQIVRGAVYLMTGMVPILELNEDYIWLGQGRVLGIPVPIYILLIVFVIVLFIMNRFKFGRHILAVGGNAQAAYVSGINTKAVVYKVYMAMGICIAIAATVLTGRAASAQPSAGLNMEMDAIAAVVVGGTSMAGGVVNVPGALFGSLIVGVVNNAMNLLKLDSNWQLIAKGGLILFAVILDKASAGFMNRTERNSTMKKAMSISAEREKKDSKEEK